jgi:hypothetical protein
MAMSVLMASVISAPSKNPQPERITATFFMGTSFGVRMNDKKIDSYLE